MFTHSRCGWRAFHVSANNETKTRGGPVIYLFESVHTVHRRRPLPPYDHHYKLYATRPPLPVVNDEIHLGDRRRRITRRIHEMHNFRLKRRHRSGGETVRWPRELNAKPNVWKKRIEPLRFWKHEWIVNTRSLHIAVIDDIPGRSPMYTFLRTGWTQKWRVTFFRKPKLNAASFEHQQIVFIHKVQTCFVDFISTEQ